MKHTTRTLSWLLVCTAIAAAACGDRSETNTKIRRGDASGVTTPLEAFDSKLANAAAALSGYWIQELPGPTTEDGITRLLYWKIADDQKSLIANLLCESADTPKGVISSGSTRLQANAQQLLLKDDQSVTTTLDGKKPTDAKIPCALVENKALMTYNLDGDHLHIVDQDNHPVRDFCRATWDDTNHRPVPVEACATKTDETTPSILKSDLPEASDLKDRDSDESKVVLKSEGDMSEKIKVENARWKHQLAVKNGVSSFLTMDLKIWKGQELMFLTKTCYLRKDKAASRVDIQVNPAAIFSGKAIRTIEEKSVQVKAKDNKPACELKVSKTTMTYVATDTQLTINTERGLEVYNILPGTGPATSDTTQATTDKTIPADKK